MLQLRDLRRGERRLRRLQIGLGRGQRGLRLGERGLLRRRVDPRQHLARRHLVADLDVDLRQDPSLFETHVHAAGRQEGAGPADNRRHGAAGGGGGANRGSRGLREHGVVGDQTDEENRDQAESRKPGARAREPEASPKLWQWFERGSLPHQTFPGAFVWIILNAPYGVADGWAWKLPSVTPIEICCPLRVTERVT